MAKYKKFLICSFFAIFVLSLPVALLRYDHVQSKKLYDECMTWDGATEEECIHYLD